MTTQKATAISDAVLIHAMYTLGGGINREMQYEPEVKIIETECNDFDGYKALPNVIEFGGIRYGKTGWSSDTFKACYKSTKLFARAVVGP